MSMEHAVPQGSEAWLLLRRGKPTASEFHNLVTPEFKIRTGQTPQSYIYAKAAEMFCGITQEDQANSWAMQQGTMLESEAIPYYELVHDVKVRRVGFVTTDNCRIGCSPDGLIGEDGGIEIKSPQPPKHVQNLMEGIVPKEYLPQIHGSMFVTGRPWWIFMSYSRKFPPLIVCVERDERIQAVLREALDGFLARFDETMAKIESMGPKKRRKAAA